MGKKKSVSAVGKNSMPRYVKLAIAEYILRHCGCAVNESELAHFVKNPSVSIVSRCRGGKVVTARVINLLNVLIAQL